MSNFGFSQLRVVNPYEVAFREARSAVGASAVLQSARTYLNVPEAVVDSALVIGTTGVAHRRLKHPFLRLDQSKQLISENAASIALLFGSEKVGLSNEDLSYCHAIVNIPTVQENTSMNLGQAVAVCLYELIREPTDTAVLRAREPATTEDLERLTGILSDALVSSGYTKSGAVDSTTEKVRRLIRRLNLSKEDTELLLGMLRKISRRE